MLYIMKKCFGTKILMRWHIPTHIAWDHMTTHFLPYARNMSETYILMSYDYYSHFVNILPSEPDPHSQQEKNAKYL